MRDSSTREKLDRIESVVRAWGSPGAGSGGGGVAPVAGPAIPGATQPAPAEGLAPVTQPAPAATQPAPAAPGTATGGSPGAPTDEFGNPTPKDEQLTVTAKESAEGVQRANQELNKQEQHSAEAMAKLKAEQATEGTDGGTSGEGGGGEETDSTDYLVGCCSRVGKEAGARKRIRRIIW